MADYIQETDAGFNIQQGVIMKEVTTNATAWGITTADITALTTKQTAWSTAYAAVANPNDRTRPAISAKDEARVDYEKSLRKFIKQWIANNPKVPVSSRERMGLNIASETRTGVPVPITFPIGKIDFSVRMQHSIAFVDSETPNSKAKPEGVHGCEVWAKIGGDAPKTKDEVKFLKTATRTPCTYTFEGEDAGKTVYYWLRWVNTKGETGPWGTPVQAMVAS